MKIISDLLLEEFKEKIDFSPVDEMNNLADEEIDLDYFEFYSSISSVYSSRIEGETIELDSYLKHKFLNVEFLPHLTKRVDDLFKAYLFIKNEKLTYQNLLQSHEILSENILPQHQRGKIRNDLMSVINEKGQIVYFAASQFQVNGELEKLFSDINDLLHTELTDKEVFYYASYIHLVYAKIHTMSDGNGRSARILEKWFLLEKLGFNAFAVPLERNYYQNLSNYYRNLQMVGLEYEELDYSKSLPFLLMTINSLKNSN